MAQFDKVSKHYDRFMEFFKAYKLAYIKEALALHGDEVIVDFGGGTGRLAHYLSSHCMQIHVLDESTGMLSHVQKQNNVFPILGNALETPFDHDSIDVAILSDVLHHVAKQQHLITEIARILKPQGKLLILDFERKHYKTRLLKWFEYFVFGKLWYRSSEEVLSLMQNHFRKILVQPKGHYYIIVGEKYETKP